MGYLDGYVPEPSKTITSTDKGAEVTIPNPEYARWTAQDQTVLAYLLRNMSREVLTQLVGLTSSVAVWKAVTEMFSSQSKARVVHLRTQLNQTRRENFSTGAAYFDRVKSLTDEMCTAGKPQDDDDVASYILAGLDDEYNGFMAAITALIKAQQSVRLGDLYSQFLSYESCLEGQNPNSGTNGDLSVNAASRGNYGNRANNGEGVAMEATLKEEAMVATLKEEAMVDIAKTTSISNNIAKVEDVPFMIDKDRMLYARFAARVGIRRFAVGRDSTKTFKVLNAPLMQRWDHMMILCIQLMLVMMLLIQRQNRHWDLQRDLPRIPQALLRKVPLRIRLLPIPLNHAYVRRVARVHVCAWQLHSRVPGIFCAEFFISRAVWIRCG
ncbi:hypothetical protein QYE76_025798 [Lolium multiflorum]|uniref:Uncharacterized protein n=1 Tax=Lolium multiflorum TaxID=4521 RepID=A0AAD8RGD2_LOLMU|nr:hypothetical protein QYE76_025798 [Lolium multiflorum]